MAQVWTITVDVFRNDQGSLANDLRIHVTAVWDQDGSAGETFVWSGDFLYPTDPVGRAAVRRAALTAAERLRDRALVRKNVATTIASGFDAYFTAQGTLPP